MSHRGESVYQGGHLSPHEGGLFYLSLSLLLFKIPPGPASPPANLYAPIFDDYLTAFFISWAYPLARLPRVLDFFFSEEVLVMFLFGFYLQVFLSLILLTGR